MIRAATALTVLVVAATLPTTIRACTHREAARHPHRCSQVIFLAPHGVVGHVITPTLPWKPEPEAIA